jgi:hypothetical protein
MLDAGASISSFESDAERFHDFDTRELIMECVPNAFRDRTVSNILRLFTNPLLSSAKFDHPATLDALLAENGQTGHTHQRSFEPFSTGLSELTMMSLWS